MPDIVIRGKDVLLPEGLEPAAIHIANGTIVEIGPYDDVPSGAEVVTAEAGHVVAPGLVDTHVHVNEPGRTGWEGFETATRAAAAGGVTTLVDMPLNSIPATTTLEALHIKTSAATGKCHVDVAFWGGVVPGNSADLQPLYDAGVVGFKCFLIPSGVDEFAHVTEPDLREAMDVLARLNATLIVHAETPAPVEQAQEAMRNDDPRCYETFLASRPRQAEDEAVALVIRMSRETGGRIHIVHHSSSNALPELRAARAEGIPVTIETCPHYLCFFAEDIPDGSTEFKCCPPVRERENAEALWKALDDGLIEMVVSDHSPCPPEMKQVEAGDFMRAWGGVASLQFRLPVMWTAASARGYSLERLFRLLSTAPADLAGLSSRKGSLRVGGDADVVIWNPHASFRIEPSINHHRHKMTPYNDRVVNGVVSKTWVRGRLAYDNGTFSTEPVGNLISRGGAEWISQN